MILTKQKQNVIDYTKILIKTLRCNIINME